MMQPIWVISYTPVLFACLGGGGRKRSEMKWYFQAFPSLILLPQAGQLPGASPQTVGLLLSISPGLGAS